MAKVGSSLVRMCFQNKAFMENSSIPLRGTVVQCLSDTKWWFSNPFIGTRTSIVSSTNEVAWELCFLDRSFPQPLPGHGSGGGLQASRENFYYIFSSTVQRTEGTSSLWRCLSRTSLSHAKFLNFRWSFYLSGARRWPLDQMYFVMFYLCWRYRKKYSMWPTEGHRQDNVNGEKGFLETIKATIKELKGKCSSVAFPIGKEGTNVLHFSNWKLTLTEPLRNGHCFLF